MLTPDHLPMPAGNGGQVPSPEPDASIVITTKNRKEELRVAVASALGQVGVALEVVVIDDGSNDGTTAMLLDEFPSVRIERRDQSAGLIVRRNEGARLARSPIVFSIDDDAAFPSPHTVRQTLAEFANPQVGAVAIPFINVRQDNRIRQLAPDEFRDYATFAYIGTAHAVRRDLFLSLGGYREILVHQGEESDFCIRLLDAGYFVKVGRSDPIHHFESPRRDNKRMSIHGRRNDLLFAVFNVPWVYLPVHIAATTINGMRFGLQAGHVAWAIEGIARGYATALLNLKERKPVSSQAYRYFRMLKRREMLPASAVAAVRAGAARRLQSS